MPQEQHYVPQFYLKNFSSDPQKKKIQTVSRHGSRAIWSERSIRSIGFENDLYVHIQNGAPVSVESNINRRIEGPISKTETWHKIVNGHEDKLDKSDKPTIYALIRHLEARNPHYFETTLNLAREASLKNSDIGFTKDERRFFSQFNDNPDLAKIDFNRMASSLKWAEEDYHGCGISIFRSPIPLRSSSTPVISIRAPMHTALKLPLPGMIPFQRLLPLNRNTIAILVIANFSNGFSNEMIDITTAKGFRRQYLAHFSYFQNIRHLISDEMDLIEDMTWAPYNFTSRSMRSINFERKSI